MAEKFSNGIHLCGEEHNCSFTCEISGYCLITPVTEKAEVYNKNSKTINYKIYDKQERKENMPCKIKIPEYELSHYGIHKCYGKNDKEIEHKCGFECKQCGNFCALKKDHSEILTYISLFILMKVQKIFILV